MNLSLKTFPCKEIEDFAHKMKYFLKNQSLNYLKQNEIILSYQEIQKALDCQTLMRNIAITNIEKDNLKQFHFTMTHQEHKFISNLNFEIDDFILSANKSHIIFSVTVKDVHATADSSIWHKLKINFLGFILKLCPNYINHKLFDEKDFGSGVKSCIIDNKIKIDFKELVQTTPLAKTFLGLSILDLIQVIRINIHKKGFGIKFNMSTPEWLKNLLLLIISIISKKLFHKLTLIRFLKYTR